MTKLIILVGICVFFGALLIHQIVDRNWSWAGTDTLFLGLWLIILARYVARRYA